jgi:hypothetical protein
MDAKSPTRNAALSWIFLAGILILFLVYLAWLHPANWFGRVGDDAFFFSSAKALAQGRGYIIPSLPGNPPQTKYPVLYPWLLSGVWKLDPSFPSNLALGVSLTAFFSCWFLVAAFVLLRKLEGVGEWPALAMVALCAFEPHFVLLSGSLMSDLPFMALALTAALAGDRAMRSESRVALAAFAGALAGLSMMMRSIGIAVVAGILVAAIYRRTFRHLAAFCLGAAPFFAAALWPLRLSSAQSGIDSSTAMALPGWQQTLLYDTSYLKMWRLCVPNFHVFWAMIRSNLEQFILTPATYFLSPTLNTGHSWVANSLGAFVGLFSLAGLVRQARGQEWKPIHFVFLFYVAITLLWNYPIMYRFLLLFLPLFLAGLWIEGKRLATLIIDKLGAAQPPPDRALAGTAAVGMATMISLMAWNFAAGYRPQLKAISAQHRESTQQMLPLYAWIRENTAPNTVIVATQDVELYLYTGRQATVPIAFSTAYIYTGDRGLLELDLDHITDTAVAFGACYWLTTPNDFEMLDFPTSEPQDRVAQLTADLPQVWRSEDGRTRLYDASSLSHQTSSACEPHAAGAN